MCSTRTSGAVNPSTRTTILASATVDDPLPRCPADPVPVPPARPPGAVALIPCNRAVARESDATPVALRAAVVRTRRFGSFGVFSPWVPPGTPTSVTAGTAQRPGFAGFRAAWPDGRCGLRTIFDS